MVKRNSKYKTNRRITKNTGSIVEGIVVGRNAYNQIDFSSSDYYKWNNERAIDYGEGGYDHKYKIFTVNTNYEQIDKKKRKKLYKKACDKACSDSDSNQDFAQSESVQEDSAQLNEDSHSRHNQNEEVVV